MVLPINIYCRRKKPWIQLLELQQYVSRLLGNPLQSILCLLHQFSMFFLLLNLQVYWGIYINVLGEDDSFWGFREEACISELSKSFQFSWPLLLVSVGK